MLVQDAYSLLGANPTYESFWIFVKNEVIPFLDFELIEEEWYKRVITSWLNDRENITLVSRGHGKTILLILFTMYLVCCQPINPITKKNMTRRLIISSQKQLIYSELQKLFFNNPNFKELVPISIKKVEESTKLWNQDMMQLRNGSVIFFRELGSKNIRGIHPDSIGVDDSVVERPSILDKDLIALFLGAVHGTMGARKAYIQVTGTTLRFSDLHQYILKNIPTYKKIILPAIIDGKTLSSRFTLDELKKIRERDGSVRFSCEYLLEPIDDMTTLIKRAHLLYCQNPDLKLYNTLNIWSNDEIKFELKKKFIAIYLGVDFAFSDRTTADKSAFVIIGETTKDNFQILDIITKKGMTVDEQMKLIQKLHGFYNFSLIGLEENSIKAVSADLKKWNLPIKLFWTGNRDQKGELDKVKPVVTVGKSNLIMRLGTFFENKKMIIPYGDEYSKENYFHLEAELLTFTNDEGKLIEQGEHSDRGISLDFALEVATRWNKFFVI